MKRFSLLLAILVILCSDSFLVGSAQDTQTIDATRQVQRPPRGRGPFPGSASPGHSAGLPIRLELVLSTSTLRSNGPTPIDFIITNIGTEPFKLPCSIKIPKEGYPEEALTLWVTSDAFEDQYFRDATSGRRVKIMDVVGISAELDGISDDPKSFNVLTPNQSIRVNASLGQLKVGTHSFTAHAELARFPNGGTEVIGTADSKVTMAVISPNSR
jgi:hypothetical protein